MNYTKVYIEYIENKVLINNKFDIDKTYYKMIDNNGNTYYTENDKIEMLTTDNFIDYILKWCRRNDKLFAYNSKLFTHNSIVKLNKLNFYNENTLNDNDNYINVSLLDNVLLKNANNIINITYKFKSNNVLYNDVIKVIFDFKDYNNSLYSLIKTIITNISFNEYNKVSNQEYLKQTKEDLNQLLDNYNNGIKMFMIMYDKNYKELEENNNNFKQDVNQRFTSIEDRIKEISKTIENNKEFLMNSFKQPLDNINEIIKKAKNINKKALEINIKTSNIIKDIKLKNTVSKVYNKKTINNIKKYYKELIVSSNKTINSQLNKCQQNIDTLSFMNRTLILLILCIYYFFLFMFYYN